MIKLKELREKQNLNKKEMASKLNIKERNYLNYENGVSEPEQETLIKIADYFNVSIDYLLDRKNNNYNLPALTNEQLELVKNIVLLNKTNLIKVSSYTLGLLACQI